MATDLSTIPIEQRIEFVEATIAYVMAERAALPERYPHRQRRRALREQIEALWVELDGLKEQAGR